MALERTGRAPIWPATLAAAADSSSWPNASSPQSRSFSFTRCAPSRALNTCAMCKPLNLVVGQAEHRHGRAAAPAATPRTPPPERSRSPSSP
eukprot:725520-Pyramimonas_sp.AAC.1